MDPVQVNKLKIYPFKSKAELIDNVIDKHKILIAINAENIKFVFNVQANNQ
jgi:hypothetical protein